MNIARRSTLIIILIAVLAAVCAGVLWFNHSGKEPLVTVVHRPEVVMNVFIHGTFGTLLGLFSLYPIVKDEIKGTLYNKVLRKMRKNPFFFKEQPIFSRGMHKINPTFDLSETGSHKYGAYPIIKAFDEVSEAISPGKYKNDYYTFGWTGFMSKTRRRAESIRLYNALNEAIAEYASQGIKPKIRILAHSHGGNLALQLAGVNELLLEGEAQALERYADDADRKESLIELSKIISKLPSQEQASAHKGQKRLDYKPLVKSGADTADALQGSFSIDELVLLGTPIQPETDHYCYSSTFKKIYSLYSGEDMVQRMDWVTTRRYFSEQRFDLVKWKKNRITGKPEAVASVEVVAPATQLVQSKIIISCEDTTVSMTHQESLRVAAQDQIATQASTSWWSNLFADRPVKRTTFDPGHKDLWFIMKNKNAAEEVSILSPLPTVVFFPVFVNLLKEHPKLEDTDLHISVCGGDVVFYLTEHNERASKKIATLPVDFINDLKAKVLPWAADSAMRDRAYELISSYAYEK